MVTITYSKPDFSVVHPAGSLMYWLAKSMSEGIDINRARWPGSSISIETTLWDWDADDSNSDISLSELTLVIAVLEAPAAASNRSYLDMVGLDWDSCLLWVEGVFDTEMWLALFASLRAEKNQEHSLEVKWHGYSSSNWNSQACKNKTNLIPHLTRFVTWCINICSSTWSTSQ